MARQIRHNFHGEGNGNAKLTWDKVYLLRSMYKEGTTYQALANEFRISKSHVGRILNGKAWSK